MYCCVISNIKLSLQISGLKYDDILSKCVELKCSVKQNFIVLFSKYTYSIFEAGKSGVLHCNVTKIRGFPDVPEATQEICSIFPNVSLSNPIVDNITATIVSGRKINLQSLFLKLKDNYKVFFNCQKFPGLFIKSPIDGANGTISIFSSGTVNIVGVKATDHLKALEYWIDTNLL